MNDPAQILRKLAVELVRECANDANAEFMQLAWRDAGEMRNVAQLLDAGNLDAANEALDALDVDPRELAFNALDDAGCLR